MNTTKTQKQHEESGCTDYLQHNAESCPQLKQRISRSEARSAIMLQLRKWREEGQDHIYFGALNIAPDLDDNVTFGELIDVVFDTQSAIKPQTLASTTASN